MLLASLFASVARTFAPTGTAKSFRQEELCPLLGLPSDLVVATLLPYLHDTRDLVSRKCTATVHCVRLSGSCTEPGMLTAIPCCSCSYLQGAEGVHQ